MENEKKCASCPWSMCVNYENQDYLCIYDLFEHTQQEKICDQDEKEE